MAGAHGDHDIHGPVVEVWPDNSQTLDPDCDCPPDCLECVTEGVTRPVRTPQLPDVVAELYRLAERYAQLAKSLDEAEDQGFADRACAYRNVAADLFSRVDELEHPGGWSPPAPTRED